VITTLAIICTAIVAYKVGRSIGYQACLMHIAVLFPDQAQEIGLEPQDFLEAQQQHANDQ
jgi:hypothetical protein